MTVLRRRGITSVNRDEMTVPREDGPGGGADIQNTPDGPPPRVEGLPFSPGCPADDPWRWANPLPQGQTLTAAWAASERDVWAVGVAGTRVRPGCRLNGEIYGPS